MANTCVSILLESYPIGSMGRTVYLPTFTIKNQPNLGKYTSPIDPMGTTVVQPIYFWNSPEGSNL